MTCDINNEWEITLPNHLGDPLSADERDMIALILGMSSDSEVLRQRLSTFSSVFNKKLRDYIFYIDTLEQLINKQSLRKSEVIQVEDIKFQVNSALNNLMSLRKQYINDLSDLVALGNFKSFNHIEYSFL